MREETSIGESESLLDMEGKDTEVETNEDGIPYLPNPDPEPWATFTGFGEIVWGLHSETAYDNMSVTLPQESYSLSKDKVINARVEDLNVGYAFNCFSMPAIERLIDGEWVRQCNKSIIDESVFAIWLNTGTPNNIDGINGSIRGIRIEEIYPAASPGRYRLVIFTPVKKLYVEFDLVE
jgi:hypothetical protein